MDFFRIDTSRRANGRAIGRASRTANRSPASGRATTSSSRSRADASRRRVSTGRARRHARARANPDDDDASATRARTRSRARTAPAGGRTDGTTRPVGRRPRIPCTRRPCVLYIQRPPRHSADVTPRRDRNHVHDVALERSDAPTARGDAHVRAISRSTARSRPMTRTDGRSSRAFAPGGGSSRARSFFHSDADVTIASRARAGPVWRRDARPCARARRKRCGA